jgi:hypothetical protein
MRKVASVGFVASGDWCVAVAVLGHFVFHWGKSSKIVAHDVARINQG